MKDEKKDVFHSSAYAKAQNGDNIGVASTESYNVRVNISQNRSKVGGYRDSEIMRGSKENGPRAKTYTPPENTGEMGGGAMAGGARGARSVAGVKDNATAATNRAMMSAKRPGIITKK